MAADIEPLLVFGWGNPSRGDDALGPLFVDAVEALALPGVECLTDFQLQIEHALDLKGRQRILFVDASAAAAAPFHVGPVAVLRDESFTSHAMSPAAVLQTYLDVEKASPPPAWLLAIRGTDFELGAPLSGEAAHNLAAAIAWFKTWAATE
ncbi:MAG TPA: hydrogenase maturation protease [Rhodocyclaceae bacterium]